MQDENRTRFLCDCEIHVKSIQVGDNRLFRERRQLHYQPIDSPDLLRFMLMQARNSEMQNL